MGEISHGFFFRRKINLPSCCFFNDELAKIFNEELRGFLSGLLMDMMVLRTEKAAI